MPTQPFDRGSFRDPSSRVSLEADRALRTLSGRGTEDWRALRESRLFGRRTGDGSLIETTEVSEDTLQHPLIPFWSYPYEWSFSMLKKAALLQLSLLEDALAEDLTLKDATPYNIQFIGTRPVFIDIGSFRALEDGEPWLGYRQFCRQFLYPLLVTGHSDIAFQPLLRGSLDGISPGDAREMLSGKRRKPGVLTDVMLQARADRAVATRDVRTELGQAGFKKEIIVANVRRLRKVIEKSSWDPAGSTWSGYSTCDHVSTQRAPKAAFVKEATAARPRDLVWDLGANDGHFSIAAAPLARQVVAMDGDHLVIDRLFRDLESRGPANVLPLVVDLSNPSPGLGWRGWERRRLEDRGKPDMTLLLAVVHHLVIGSNLPLTEVIDWLAALGGEVVFEWVPQTDPMAQKLATNKRAWEIHDDYNEAACRALLETRFEVRREQPLESRILFHLVPRS